MEETSLVGVAKTSTVTEAEQYTSTRCTTCTPWSTTWWIHRYVLHVYETFGQLPGAGSTWLIFPEGEPTIGAMWPCSFATLTRNPICSTMYPQLYMASTAWRLHRRKYLFYLLSIVYGNNYVNKKHEYKNWNRQSKQPSQVTTQELVIGIGS